MNYIRMSTPTYKASDLGGGPFTGFSPIQSLNGHNTSDEVNSRRIVTRSWNGKGAVGVYNGYARVITPFRAVNNSGDFLARQYYVCGGPNPTNQTHNGYVIRKMGGRPNNSCDGTGVPAGSSNPKFVFDSSDYIRYKKLKTFNKSYNDLKYGGDQSNASYTAMQSVIRGKRNVAP